MRTRNPVIQTFHPSKYHLLFPRHEVRDAGKLNRLIESMQSHGWKGEPVIGYRDSSNQVQLLTGSHRYEAAKHTRTPVKVRLLSKQEMDSLGGIESYADSEDIGNALLDAGFPIGKAVMDEGWKESNPLIDVRTGKETSAVHAARSGGVDNTELITEETQPLTAVQFSALKAVAKASRDTGHRIYFPLSRNSAFQMAAKQQRKTGSGYGVVKHGSSYVAAPDNWITEAQLDTAEWVENPAKSKDPAKTLTVRERVELWHERHYSPYVLTAGDKVKVYWRNGKGVAYAFRGSDSYSAYFSPEQGRVSFKNWPKEWDVDSASNPVTMVEAVLFGAAAAATGEIVRPLIRKHIYGLPPQQTEGRQ